MALYYDKSFKVEFSMKILFHFRSVESKYIYSTVTRDVRKHTAKVPSCYHVDITLTQSHVPSVTTQQQSCHVTV